MVGRGIDVLRVRSVAGDVAEGVVGERLWIGATVRGSDQAAHEIVSILFGADVLHVPGPVVEVLPRGRIHARVAAGIGERVVRDARRRVYRDRTGTGHAVWIGCPELLRLVAVVDFGDQAARLVGDRADVRGGRGGVARPRDPRLAAVPVGHRELAGRLSG